MVYRALQADLVVEVFSHDKAVLSKILKPDTFNLVYPPFTQKKDAFIRGFLRKLT